MAELLGPVRIVGTGLIGTSIGLALGRLGVVVELVDADPDNALMAERIGAGSRSVHLEPQLVVVAVPPDHVGTVIADQLTQTTTAVVTDAASVKSKPLTDARAILTTSPSTPSPIHHQPLPPNPSQPPDTTHHPATDPASRETSAPARESGQVLDAGLGPVTDAGSRESAEPASGMGLGAGVGNGSGRGTDVGDGSALLGRYVGSHPMAGSERNGPLAARADLFDGATWAITPHETSEPDAVDLVRRLAEAAGARTVELSVEDHDLAVARVSHLPHLMSALAAGTLADAPESHLELSGQGVRDVTRIAAGDPRLWTQIVSANSSALTTLLERIRAELDRVLVALSKEEAAEELTSVLGQGVSGAVRVPGKHGAPHTELAAVLVTIPDRPGQLARLFADAAESGANVEDLRIDHSPGRPVGEVELAVKPDSVAQLIETLTTRGWTVHS